MTTPNPAFARSEARLSDRSAGHLRGVLAHLEAAKQVADRHAPWLDVRADAALSEIEGPLVDCIIAVKAAIEALEIETAPFEGDL